MTGALPPKARVETVTALLRRVCGLSHGDRVSIRCCGPGGREAVM